LEKKSGQKQTWMTQSDTNSPMNNDDTTPSKSDSQNDRKYEDDNLTNQTHGERLLEKAKVSIEANESEHNARTRVEAPRPPSNASTITRQRLTTTRQCPPTAQRTNLGLDEGEQAWLSLAQLASIIQLHNESHMGCDIVTTLLYGTERKDWDKVWTHMQAAELAATDMTNEATTRVRDQLMTYGQMLLQHENDRSSGIYPMHVPNHWRIMIVSHVLKQVFLLDPLV